MPDALPGGVIQFLPTVERIVYGRGTLDAMAAEVERFGAARVMILTARALERGALIDRIAAILGTRHAATFAAPFEHVPLESAVAAAAAARRCGAGLIVAVGGGSVIDAAKALRICIAAGIDRPGALAAFIDAPFHLINGIIPQLSIPTTLSGAEYTRSFSATDFARGRKRSYTSSAAASRAIIYDPEATLATPPGLWLSSGVMALDHAIEVFCAASPHPVGDVLKISAARALLTYLPQTYDAPADLDARAGAQVAAWMADHSPLRALALALAPAPAALPSHAIAYELGALCRVPYGLAACVTLPAFLRVGAARDSAHARRQAELARSLGLGAKGSSDADSAGHLADELDTLIARLALPARLRDLGVGRGDLARIAQAFAARGASITGAAPATAPEVVALLESAW